MDIHFLLDLWTNPVYSVMHSDTENKTVIISGENAIRDSLKSRSETTAGY